MVADYRTPTSLEFVKRVAAALPLHYKRDYVYRASEEKLVDDYKGKTTYPGCANQNSPESKQIINLTMQAAEAHAMNMAASRPRFLCSSREASLDWFAQKLARTLDRYSAHLKLEETLQEAARASYFLVGIVKVFQANSPAIALESDYRSDPGKPFCQHIPLKKFVRDVNADSPEEAAFMGDLYSISLRAALRSGRFKQSARAKLREHGDQTQTKPDVYDKDTLPAVDDVVYLADIWIRSRNAVWTFIVDQQFNVLTDEPIQKVRWHGDECGPYHFLNMGPVPNHFYPSSPGQNSRLLQEFFNSCYRKLEDQTRRMKEIGTGEHDEDIIAAQSAMDGEYKKFVNAAGITTIRMGGPDQNVFSICLNTLDQYYAANGNLKYKLGIGPSADTVGQEKMIGGNVSRIEGFYQARFVSFVRRIAQALTTLIWNDAYLEVPGVLELPGTPFKTDDSWLPAGKDGSREGTRDVFLIDIDPQSMAYRSAGERMGFIDAQVTKFAPMDPWLAQKGQSIDMGEYFNIAADYGAPEMRRIFRSNQPPMQTNFDPQQPLPTGGAKVYEHRSTGGGRGQDSGQQQLAMMGAATRDNQNQR